MTELNALSAAPRPGPARHLPMGIWALGFVSLFMDVSSEMIHAYLPLFLVGTLGASVAFVGLIEGIAEATAAVAKLGSGWLSDHVGKRKWLVVAGYAISALTKPLFAVAPVPLVVLGARFADRIGKGIRGAPRDALIGDIAPPEQRGAAYGLRQSLDNVGAFAGPVLGMGLMVLFAGNVRAVFWFAAIPALVAVGLLVLFVREPERTSDTKAPGLRWAELKGLSTAYWLVLGISALLTLARFSEAFLILKAQSTGLPFALAPIVFIVMNVVFAAAAYPIGLLSDRVGRMGFIALGFVLLIAADIALAAASSLWLTFAAVALWGLHLGLTQGILSALVADTVPPRLRGTGFGLYQLATGLTLLLASVIAGALWTLHGPSATFLFSALTAAIGLAAVFAVYRRLPNGGANAL